MAGAATIAPWSCKRIINAMNKGPKVVITGMGILSPFGVGVETFWGSLVNGECGVRRVSGFPVDSDLYICKIAAEVPEFETGQWIIGDDPALQGRYAKLAVPALGMAIEDARIGSNSDVLDSTDLYMGSAQITGDTLDMFLKTWLIGAASTLPPDTFARLDPHGVSAAASRIFGINGRAMSITASCTSGSAALMLCVENIRAGRSKIGIAVGADAISKSIFLGEGLTGELAKRNDDPKHASRPFDRGQNGYVIGEGAVAIVVEEEAHAQRRGARIYAGLGPFASTSDATSFKYIDDQGTQMGRGMMTILQHVFIREIDYINAHGPSITALDKAESLAIRRAFGDAADDIPVTSIKGAIGNPSAAGGMLQVASAVMSIRDQTIPPTLNLENPLPACDLDYVRTGARKKNVNSVLVSTHGGGGVNVALLLHRYHEEACR
jgi:3-oxoacyl-[acyl-carrier-protein] synthase II